MNKIFTLVILFAFSFSVSAQTVKKPVFVKRTASWCPFCGQWGWAFMEDVMDEFDESQAIVLGMHFSGDLQNDLSVAYAANLGGVGQPRFYLNNTDLSVNGGNGAARLESLKTTIADINTQSTEFETTISAYKHQDTPSVTARVSITPNITDFNMDYYVALYLIEDGVMNTQSGQGGSPVPHPNVMRSSFSGTSFGEIFMGSGDSWNGAALNYEYTLSDNQFITSNYLDQNFNVAVVIFSYDGSKYNVEQADMITNIGLVSSTPKIAWLSETKLFQNANGQVVFEATPENSNGEASIKLYDLSGRILYQNNVDLNQGQTVTHLIDTANLNFGSYIFNIENQDGIWSKQIIIKK